MSGRSTNRHRQKVDANQGAIVKAFRDLGASVDLLHTVGGGVPDLAVGVSGLTVLVEVKTDGGRLEESQLDYLESYQGDARVIRTIEGAAILVNQLRHRSALLRAAEAFYRDVNKARGKA